MGRGAVAKRSVGQRIGLGQGRLLEIGQGLDAGLGMGRQHMLGQAHQRHGLQVLGGVVGQVFHQRLVGRKTVGHADQRIAVSRLLGDIVDTDHGACTGLVFHDHGLAQLLGQLGANQARHHVGRAAGGEGNNDAQGLGRPAGLRPVHARSGRQSGCASGLQKMATLHAGLLNM